MSESDRFIARVTLGDQSLQKGEVREGQQLIAWDCIQDCVPHNCPIGNNCVYSALSTSDPSCKCSLQKQYLQSFVDMIFSTYRYMDEGDMFRVGMHLVPLYSQLCRQKILEKSVDSISYVDNKGNIRIHPIYRELRETMKTITSIWKDMGFQNVANPRLPDSGIVKNNGFGDPNHYERLLQHADNKRGITR